MGSAVGEGLGSTHNTRKSRDFISKVGSGMGGRGHVAGKFL